MKNEFLKIEPQQFYAREKNMEKEQLNAKNVYYNTIKQYSNKLLCI